MTIKQFSQFDYTPKQANLIILAILVFFVSLLVYGLGLTGRPIFTRGEAREGIVIQAMVQHSNYVLPITNENKIAYKPPMFHWLGAICSKSLGGISEFSVRLPSALTAAIALAFFFFYVAKISNINRALLSILILGTSFEWLRSATQARVDMCFALGLTIALCSFYLAMSKWSCSNKISLPYMIATAVSGAIAILSKGPGALIIIVAVASLYLLAITALTTTRKSIITAIFRLPLKSIICVFALSALIAFPWYYLAYVQGGSSFLDLQIMRENYARFVPVQGAHQGHSKPFYYVVIYLFLALLPWSLLLPPFCIWLYKNRKQFLQKQNSDMLFALIWVCVFILIVSSSLAKRMVYYLQALPPMAYLMSIAIENIWQNKKDYFYSLSITKWSSILVATIALVVFSSFGIANLVDVNTLISTFELSDKNKILLQGITDAKYMWAVSTIVSLLLVIFAIKIYKHAKKDTTPDVTIRLTATLCAGIFTASLSLVATPIANVISPKDTMHKLISSIPDNARLFGYEHTLYPAIYYANRLVTPTMNFSELSNVKDDIYVLLESHSKQAFMTTFPHAKLTIESDSLGANGEDKLTVFLLPGHSAWDTSATN